MQQEELPVPHDPITLSYCITEVKIQHANIQQTFLVVEHIILIFDSLP
jgi:hypothetical protein